MSPIADRSSFDADLQLEIANDADLRIRAPKDFGCTAAAHRTAVTAISPVGGRRDGRLPAVGTLLTRDFKGRTYVVKVLDDGFESGFPGDRASRGRERVK